MNRNHWVMSLIFLAVLAICIHGLITETGIVGWINHAQQSMFGSYSLKVSMIVSLFGLLFLGLGAWGLVERMLGGGEDAGLASVAGLQAAANRPASAKATVWVIAVLLAATWVIGFALYTWFNHQQRSDASATYETLVLADGVPLAVPTSTHLAVRGDLLTRHALAHSSGSGSSKREDFQLLPLAAPGWQPGKPVNFVVKIKGEWELPGANSWPRPARGAPLPPLLVRLDGDVPVPAAQQFKKMGVPLAEPSYLLHVVPSKDGRANVRDSSAENFQVFLYLCGGISILLLVFGAVMGVMMKRRQSKLGIGA
jgi:hypothetical protein